VTEISFSNKDQLKQQIKEKQRTDWVNPFQKFQALKGSGSDQPVQLTSNKDFSNKNPLGFLNPPQTKNIPHPITNYAQPISSNSTHIKKQKGTSSKK
jgi:hypothetical protein